MRPTLTLTETQRAAPPSAAPRLLRALRIVHPFPTLLNVAATAALAFVAARGTPDVRVLATMLLVMLCAQSAIGVTNDLFDRELDARTKPWKPIVAGLVAPGAALLIAVGLIAAACALASTLGLAGFALAVLGMACGLAYDVRLKRTPLSALPFMIAIPVLPVWVWVTLGEWQAVLGWLLPLGALIGLALHLANTLPDIDDDAAHGVAGLAHRLGARGSMVAGWTSFGAALALSAVIVPVAGYDLRVYAPTAAFGLLCLGSSIGLYAMRRDSFALQFGFGALGIGSVVLAAGWLAAVS